MRGIVVTDKGLEWAAQQEIKNILNKDSTAGSGTIEIHVDNMEDMCRLIKDCQSITGGGILIHHFDFKNLEDLKKKTKEGIGDFDFNDWIVKETAFRISCNREGQHKFASKDIEEEVGAVFISSVKGNLGFSPIVSLENPDFILTIYIRDEEVSIYIDFAGRDLSKRDYKLYSHPTSLRGNVTFAAVLASGYSGEGKLLDPFTGSGMIPIEACFHALNKSVHSDNDFAFLKLKPLVDMGKIASSAEKSEKINIYAFDKITKSLRYGKNNAKIAGMDGYIDFSNVGVSWLDTKFGEGEVDFVVTQPPELTNRSKSDEIKKIYDELFYQCKYILSEKGTLVILAKKAEPYEEICKKHGFSLKISRPLTIGDENYNILTFLKTKSQ